MKLTTAVCKRIRDLLKEYRLTQYQLFKITGIPQSTISTILNEDVKTIKLSTLYELCSGLNIELTKFFDADYFKIENIED